MRELAGMGLNELAAVLKDWGEPRFRAKQVLGWIYQKAALDFDQMTDLPEPLRLRLKKECVISGLRVARDQASVDGTRKLLLRLTDGNLIEAVAIPAKKRLTGCLSSQAGCRYACVFCASGKAGFKRDLSAAEMAGEVLLLKHLSRGRDLSHVVFMGTGEPLDNYDRVLETARLINSPGALAIGARRITISTCGIIPGIRRLAQEGMQIELSVSLHAADDATRSRIMPVNRKYPLKELLKGCGDYAESTGRQVTFEYILISGLNSGLQNADRLGTILRGMNCKVNLIPFNAVPGGEWTAPGRAQTREFRERLMKSGVQATLRMPRGQDIDAACGQLRLRYEDK